MQNWLKRVAIKTVKTMAQSAIGVIGSSAMLSEIDWRVVLSTVAVSGILCILMNISDIKEADL